MPTPVGHALCGALVGTAVFWQRPIWGPWKDLIFFAALAQAPDLDFIPGIVLGKPDAFHHGVTHSMGFALLFGLVMAWLGKKRDQALRWGLAGGAIYLAQVLLDVIALDTRPPYGVPLWWPLSGDFVQSHWTIFLDVRRWNLTWAVVWHDIRAMGREILLLGPPLALVLWARRQSFAAEGSPIPRE